MPSFRVTALSSSCSLIGLRTTAGTWNECIRKEEKVSILSSQDRGSAWSRDLQDSPAYCFSRWWKTGWLCGTKGKPVQSQKEWEDKILYWNCIIKWQLIEFRPACVYYRTCNLQNKYQPSIERACFSFAKTHFVWYIFPPLPFLSRLPFSSQKKPAEATCTRKKIRSETSFLRERSLRTDARYALRQPIFIPLSTAVYTILVQRKFTDECFRNSKRTLLWTIVTAFLFCGGHSWVVF